MDTLKKRLTARLSEMNLRMADLARELSIARQDIYGWTRRDQIPHKYLFETAKFLGCDSQWLQSGEFSRPQTLNISAGQTVIPIFKQGDYRDMQDGDRLKHESLVAREDWLSEVFGVNPSQGAYEIYRTESNEMQPTIMRGDLVVIDREAKSHVNGLYGIENKAGGLSIARLQFDPVGEGVAVMYDNQQYSAIKTNAGKLQLVGRVVYVWSGKKDL